MVANVQKAIKFIYSLLVNLTEPIRTHGPQSYFRSKISILSQVVPNVQKAIKLIYCPWTGGRGGDLDNLCTTKVCLTNVG